MSLPDQASDPSAREPLWPLVLAVLTLAGFWTALLLIFPPSQQDFPLNDDCLYSRTAVGFAHGQGLNYYQQSSLPMLGLLLYATPFLWVGVDWLGGGLHVVLRLATLLLGVLGLVGFYDLLRQSRFSARQAGLATACLGLNPLYFLMSGVFQTDIPTLTFSLLALACYQRGLGRKRLSWWLGGTLLALLAVSTRQNALVVPLVAGTMLLGQPGLRWRPDWLLGAVLPVAAGLAVEAWLSQRDDVPHLGPHWPSLVIAPIIVFVCLHYVGLFVAPLLLQPGPCSRRTLLIGLAAMLGMAGLVALIKVPRTFQDALQFRGIFPYWGNMITPWGQYEMHFTQYGHRPEVLDLSTRVVLTLAGCLAGAGLLARIGARWQRETLLEPLALFTLLELGLLFLAPVRFDRYLLMLLPGGIALAAGRLATWRAGASLGLVALYGLLSFASVHDFLSWNRALWELGRRAVQERHIDPTDIEGGFTWDGWYSPHGANDPVKAKDQGKALPFTRANFPHVTGRYVLSFSLELRSTLLDCEPYTLWLAPGSHEILLMQEPDPP